MANAPYKNSSENADQQHVLTMLRRVCIPRNAVSRFSKLPKEMLGFCQQTHHQLNKSLTGSTIIMVCKNASTCSSSLLFTSLHL